MIFHWLALYLLVTQPGADSARQDPEVSPQTKGDCILEAQDRDIP
jgi:hypothetical protein